MESVKEPLMVRVTSITYNQAPYIRQCLDGFVMQKTNFRFEVVIHDDASTDGTDLVIREYSEKYPDIIKPIFEAENQYSKGGFALVTKAFEPYCKEPAKYIAQCEGDDYWTDPLKLQKQVDWMDTHTDFAATATNSRVITESGEFVRLFSELPTRKIDSMRDLVRGRKFHTASVLYKVDSLMKNDYNLSAKSTWDTFLWCCLLTSGPIYYSDEVTCVYRRGIQGITEYTPKFQWICQVEKWASILFDTFAPKYINKEDAYFLLENDIYSALQNKDRFDISQIRYLRKILWKYSTHNIRKELPLFYHTWISSYKYGPLLLSIYHGLNHRLFKNKLPEFW